MDQQNTQKLIEVIDAKANEKSEDIRRQKREKEFEEKAKQMKKAKHIQERLRHEVKK
jgi:hypothetical protein